MTRARVRLCGLVVAVALAPAAALARPGGGSSFGGGSRSSSSSSSSRSSSSSSNSSTTSSRQRVVEWVYRVGAGEPRAASTPTPWVSPFPPPAAHSPVSVGPDTRTPQEKLPEYLRGIVFFVLLAASAAGALNPLARIGQWLNRRRDEKLSWSTDAPPPPTNPGGVRRLLATIRDTDAAFSAPILEDFLATLYVEAHTVRGKGTLDGYSAYLRPKALSALAALPKAEITTVVVGAMHPAEFQRDDALKLHRITYELETNLSESNHGARPQSFYAAERWTLVRSIGAVSRPPARARALVCPSCGAPLDKTTRGRCGYCKQAADSGQFDWVVERIEIVTREPRPPMLTGTTEEHGTDAPTVFEPNLDASLAAARANGFDPETVLARTRAIFIAMQDAWSNLAWDRARPYLSDRLWTAQTYWIAAYRAQGLRNVTTDTALGQIELVRLASDAYFLSVTVRVHACGHDYTVRDADGEIVGGSKTKTRAYTEYWTLLRSMVAPTENGCSCPACGGPLGNSMVARCGHCGALVEASTFDWVLSRIDQDDVYRG